MIEEIVTRAAEDLTTALNNFNGFSNDIFNENKATLKEELNKVIAKGFDEEKASLQNKITKAEEELNKTASTATANISTVKAKVENKLNESLETAKVDIANVTHNGVITLQNKTDDGTHTLETKTAQGKTSLEDALSAGLRTLEEKITSGETTLNTTTISNSKSLNHVKDTAITELQNKYNELKATLDKTNARFEQKKDELLIGIFSKSVFVQYPDMPTPDTFLSFEGYRWAEVNYGGAFFRASGGAASAFNSGAQGDAIRNITGKYTYFYGEPWKDKIKGAYCLSHGATKITGQAWIYNDNSAINFDASRVVPTAEENRPVNYTVRLWKLEKI